MEKSQKLSTRCQIVELPLRLKLGKQIQKQKQDKIKLYIGSIIINYQLHIFIKIHMNRLNNLMNLTLMKRIKGFTSVHNQHFA